MTPLQYLSAYPAELQAQARELIHSQRLGAWLKGRYPAAHGIRSDGALYSYVSDLKAQYLRSAAPIDKVAYDSKLQVIAQALGTHTTHSRVQGSRLKAKHEIRIAAVFRDAPLPLLRMISVHELAHLREREHNKAFYQLCQHMEPDYHSIELDLRLYLTHLDLTGERLWAPAGN